MSVKVVNYTEDMVARLHEVYDVDADEATREAQIVALSDELGRSVRSIRAKLTSEGIYVAKAKVESGKNVVRKATLVAAIAAQLDVHVEAVESLEKANKATLARVYKALAS